MSRIISRAESWERAYEAFSRVNFSSFDFDSIKESMLDYIKLYFPEDFNDFIESSEFIAILEMFAYLGELLAYRIDLNAHENFISVAERKESVLRLAKLISYSASRNVPARGLVKITSIQTTENVYDSNGINISNKKINWNDANNTDWKEQFLLIMNRVLQQEFGSVLPSDRLQIDDVLFELYNLNNNPININSASYFTYDVSVSGQSYPMELVPVDLDENGPKEKRPEVNAPFSLVYASDGLGDASDTTGFLCFTKQGTLQRRQTVFDGVTPNQTYDITVNDINQTDVWVNNVDPNTRQILTKDPFSNISTLAAKTRYGEWVEVDVSNAQNILFNTNTNRRKYEIETLANDNIRLVFGDGEFADIPNGSFDVWFRTSENVDIAIPQSSVVDKTASFSYNDVDGNTQTITFTFSLINSLLNNSASEDIDHIRRVAPSVYYTQDRMVNSRDYNTFPLQDPSILKLRTVNRTFAGDSRYIPWHDPSGSYENVKIFGDDLALYFVEDSKVTKATNTSSVNAIIQSYIEPYLSSTDVFVLLAPSMKAANKNPSKLRKVFDNRELSYASGTYEKQNIIDTINDVINNNSTAELFYSATNDEWTVGSQYSDSVKVFTITNNSGSINIEVQYRRLIAHSDTTKFWHTNDANQIVNFDTFNTTKDLVTVLKANKNSSNTALLNENVPFNVIGQDLTATSTPLTGLPNINTLSVITTDVNEDGIPDDIVVSSLFDYENNSNVLPAAGGTVILDNVTTTLEPEVSLSVDDGTGTYVSLEYNTDWVLGNPGDDLSDTVTFQSTSTVSSYQGNTLKVRYHDYVYLYRSDINGTWRIVEPTTLIKTNWNQENNGDSGNYTRKPGRSGFNFAWFHYTPQYHLVDPAPTNINDMFIITKGYFSSMQRWLSGQTNIKPEPPSSLSLRTSYATLLENKMISDSTILHSGKFKLLFGPHADSKLKARLKIIRSQANNMTDNQVKATIVNVVREFFNIKYWEFGETFYFTELSTSIHNELGTEIDSVVLVPEYTQNQFGDLFEVQAREDEILYADITTNEIDVVTSYTPNNLRQQ